jgi:hypothetical protein
LIWTDGEQVYSFTGNKGIDLNFGYRIQSWVQSTSLALWKEGGCAVWDPPLYILSNGQGQCYVWDAQFDFWMGPWLFNVHAFDHDRDLSVDYFADSTVSSVRIWNDPNQLTDLGVAIPWSFETKYYNGGKDIALKTKRMRKAYITADGSTGTVTVTLRTDTNPTFDVTRSVVFSGAQPQVKTLYTPGPIGQHHGIIASGTGKGNIYELGMQVYPIRDKK